MTTTDPAGVLDAHVREIVQWHWPISASAA
jgi:hypothetical protein